MFDTFEALINRYSTDRWMIGDTLKSKYKMDFRSRLPPYRQKTSESRWNNIKNLKRSSIAAKEAGKRPTNVCTESICVLQYVYSTRKSSTSREFRRFHGYQSMEKDSLLKKHTIVVNKYVQPSITWISCVFVSLNLSTPSLSDYSMNCKYNPN